MMPINDVDDLTMLIEKQVHEHATTQINLDPYRARQVNKWAMEHIDHDDFSELEDDDGGLEDTSHVTVRYGIGNDQIDAVRTICDETRPFTVAFGKTAAFSNDKHDVLYVAIKSPELAALNKKLMKLPGKSSDHGDYVPHMTIAYLKPGRVKRFLDRDLAVQSPMIVSEIVFSSKTGSSTPIQLKGS